MRLLLHGSFYFRHPRGSLEVRNIARLARIAQHIEYQHRSREPGGSRKDDKGNQISHSKPLCPVRESSQPGRNGRTADPHNLPALPGRLRKSAGSKRSIVCPPKRQCREGHLLF